VTKIRAWQPRPAPRHAMGRARMGIACVGTERASEYDRPIVAWVQETGHREIRVLRLNRRRTAAQRSRGRFEPSESDRAIQPSSDGRCPRESANSREWKERRCTVAFRCARATWIETETPARRPDEGDRAQWRSQGDTPRRSVGHIPTIGPCSARVIGNGARRVHPRGSPSGRGEMS
jgi:hypothetical protein